MLGLVRKFADSVQTSQESGLLSHRLSPWRYIPPHERLIDPIGEAEVFLAYGKRREALRVLNHTLRHQPDNLEAKVLLLQTFAYLRDIPSYCALARELAPVLAGKASWQTICAEGLELAPYEPLFMYQA
jgi:pilus assembly protein FimV